MLLSLLLAGCTRSADLRDVPGTYVMNQGQAADTLVVKAEGQYRRIYVMPGQVAIIDTGAWTIDTIGAEVLITFAHFVPRWRAETDPPELRSQSLIQGFWPTQPERTASGRIRIVVDPDDSWAYVRTATDH